MQLQRKFSSTAPRHSRSAASINCERSTDLRYQPEYRHRTVTRRITKADASHGTNKFPFCILYQWPFPSSTILLLSVQRSVSGLDRLIARSYTASSRLLGRERTSKFNNTDMRPERVRMVCTLWSIKLTCQDRLLGITVRGRLEKSGLLGSRSCSIG